MKNQLRSVYSLLGILMAVLTAFGVLGCAKKETAQGTSGKREKIIVGVLARDEPDMQKVVPDLAAIGYDLEVRIFNDNALLNASTEDGSIQVNYFQNEKYLEETYKAGRNSQLIAVGPPIFANPHVLISKRWKKLSDIPNGARIGVSNDANNRGRNLKLIAASGLITLKPGIPTPTTLDVVNNPRNIQFFEADPRSMTSFLPDLDAIVSTCSTVYTMNDPEITVDTALAMETREIYQEYGGLVFVVMPQNKDAPWLNKLLEITTSPQYGDWLLATFKGAKRAYFHN
jgi:D-methionine transport system substrate-binding protein